MPNLSLVCLQVIQVACGRATLYTNFDRSRPTCPLFVYQVVQVACGRATLYALTNQGELFSWGQGSQGELGTGGNTKATGNPGKLSWAKDIVRVEAAGSGRFAAAVDGAGRVYTWGAGEQGVNRGWWGEGGVLSEGVYSLEKEEGGWMRGEGRRWCGLGWEGKRKGGWRRQGVVGLLLLWMVLGGSIPGGQVRKQEVGGGVLCFGFGVGVGEGRWTLVQRGGGKRSGEAGGVRTGRCCAAPVDMAEDCVVEGQVSQVAGGVLEEGGDWVWRSLG